MNKMKRHCRIGIVILFAALNHAGAALLEVNYSALVSRADLDYTAPASRSEEGMPHDGKVHERLEILPS